MIQHRIALSLILTSTCHVGMVHFLFGSHEYTIEFELICVRNNNLNDGLGLIFAMYVRVNNVCVCLCVQVSQPLCSPEDNGGDADGEGSQPGHGETSRVPSHCRETVSEANALGSLQCSIVAIVRTSVSGFDVATVTVPWSVNIITTGELSANGAPVIWLHAL